MSRTAYTGVEMERQQPPNSLVPWERSQHLTLDRLLVVGRIVRDVRNAVVALHTPEDGDNDWSLGCRAYARTCFALTHAADKYDWLSVVPDPDKPQRFVFAINGVPVRFYHGTYGDPPDKYRWSTHVEDWLRQEVFQIDGVSFLDRVYRLAVATGPSRKVSSVALVEMDDQGSVSGFFSIPLDSDRVLPLQRPEINLPRPTVLPLDEDSETDEDALGRAERDAS